MSNLCARCGKRTPDNMLYCNDCSRTDAIEKLQRCRLIFSRSQNKYNEISRLQISLMRKMSESFCIGMFVFFIILGFIAAAGISVDWVLNNYTISAVFVDAFLITVWVLIGIGIPTAITVWLASNNLNRIGLEL